jgi:hypothetical protein
VKCSRCKGRSTPKYLDAHDGFCARCYALEQLVPYDAARIEAEVLDHRRGGMQWDKVCSEIKKKWQPPADRSYWIDLTDIVWLGVRSLNWRVA